MLKSPALNTAKAQKTKKVNNKYNIISLLKEIVIRMHLVNIYIISLESAHFINRYFVKIIQFFLNCSKMKGFKRNKMNYTVIVPKESWTFQDFFPGSKIQQLQRLSINQTNSRFLTNRNFGKTLLHHGGFAGYWQGGSFTLG